MNTKRYEINNSTIKLQSDVKVTNNQQTNANVDNHFNNNNKIDEKIENAKKNQYRHAISFGDSQVERQAIFDIGKYMVDTYVKSIKFVSNPTIYELLEELHIVYQNLNHILSHPGHLDYEIQIKRQNITNSNNINPGNNDNEHIKQQN